MIKLIPNEFQKEALKNLSETDKEGGVVVMPTGTGKTFLSVLWVIEKLKINPDAKFLFVCHSNDILFQANEEEFQHHLTDINLSYSYYNALEKVISQITFGTVQTLYRSLNILDKNTFDYIIIDEAHHYQARTFKEVITHFEPKFKLGLTATPARGDGKDIYRVIGEQVYAVTTKEAIEKNLLSKINYWFVDNDIDFTDIEWNGSRYSEKDLNKKLCVQSYDEAVVKEYEETALKEHNRKKTMIFGATIKHCKRLEYVFTKAGYRAISLTSGNKKDRKKIIQDYKEHIYDIIIVRDMFNEGVNIPSADCVMMLRPTFSGTIFTQQVGRSLRIYGNKDYALILDFTSNAKNNSINDTFVNEIIDIDLKEEVDKNHKVGKKNEFIIFNDYGKVRLSKRKFDVLNQNNYYKDDLIEAYFDLKKELGKVPSSKEMGKKGKYSKSSYIRWFGSWNKFMKSINEPVINFNFINNKEDMIEAYFDLKKELGRVPTQREMDKKGKCSKNVYNRYFGSWNKTKEFMSSLNPEKHEKKELGDEE